MSDEAPAGAVQSWLGSRLRLRQPASGHRAGTDAVLLAAAADPGHDDQVFDVGSGVGSVGLAIALHEAKPRVLLLERDPALAALAAENVIANDLSNRVSGVEGDLFDTGLADRIGRASLVVSNPPFYEAGSVRAPRDPLKRQAYLLGEQRHGDWLRAMLALAAPHARLILIHRPEALPALLAAGEGRMGGWRVWPILGREGGTAVRIVVGGIVGSRAPFEILAPLVLHEASGSFTPQAEALHRGTKRAPLFTGKTRKSRPGGPAFLSSEGVSVSTP